MVRGLDVFEKHFSGQNGKYVLIGGVACDIAMNDAGLEFRATKDLDIVLIIETLDAEFFHQFWDFIKKGNYKNRQKSTGNKLFYRFYEPEDQTYPYMLELFSRIPDSIKNPYDGQIVPIPMNDEVSSLSAILLDDDYYRFIKEGITHKDETPFLSPLYLIPLKAKAFIDLTEKKNSGENIDSRDVSKHKNDVFRLYQILSLDKSIKLPKPLIDDMKQFITMITDQKIDLTAFGIKKQPLDDVLNNLKKIYNLFG